jgi:hypothetical protein
MILYLWRKENFMKIKFTIIFVGLITLLACTSRTSTTKNYFEGKLTFKNTYIIKTNKVDSTELDKIFGKTAETLFKEGNFLEKYDGGFMLWQIYNKYDNKNYVNRNQLDTVYWFDCGQKPQKIIRSEINFKKEKILGIECDELITYYDDKIITYYFNPDTLKINPEWYKEHTYSNKDINAKKMKSIYLKYKIEYPDMIFIVTATSIEWQSINDTLFFLPKNTILIEEN